MHRAIPVGNKVCAARVRQRYEGQRAQRLREMKPLVDTKPPETTGYAHLKNNWKRDELVAQRHDTIERDNMTMLTKMHDFARNLEYSVPRASSLPALRATPGGPAQQREYDRIMQANAVMLSRLQRTQGEINVRKLEQSYEKSGDYLRLACEYPPPAPRRRPQRRSTTPSRAGLTRLPGAGGAVGASLAAARGGGPSAVAEDLAAGAEGDLELRYVLQEERVICGATYSLEMATDGRALAVSIFNVDAGQGLELLIGEEDHRVLYEECGGDYAAMADRLRVSGDQLFVGPLKGDHRGAADAVASQEPGHDDGDGSSVVDVEDDDEEDLLEGSGSHGQWRGLPEAAAAVQRSPAAPGVAA